MFTPKPQCNCLRCRKFREDAELVAQQQQQQQQMSLKDRLEGKKADLQGKLDGLYAQIGKDHVEYANNFSNKEARENCSRNSQKARELLVKLRMLNEVIDFIQQNGGF